MLVHQARNLLEVASGVIGRRVGTDEGDDAMRTYSGLFESPGPGGCLLGEDLRDCLNKGRQSLRGKKAASRGKVESVSGSETMPTSPFQRRTGTLGNRPTAP